MRTTARPVLGGCAPDPAMWTEKHEKEASFQRTKRLRRAMDALAQGALLPREIQEEFGSEAVADLVLRAKAIVDQRQMAAYMRKKSRTWCLDAPRPPGLTVLHNKRIFIDRQARTVMDAAELDNRMVQLGAIAEPLRESSDCFVVPDVTASGQRVLWNAMLSGGLVVSVAFFLAGHGPSVMHKPAIKTRRKVGFSEGFRAARPILMNICLTRLAARGAAWTVCADRGAFLAARRPRGHPAETVAFLAEAEAGDGDPELAFAKRLTAASAPAFLAVVQRAESRTGMCLR